MSTLVYVKSLLYYSLFFLAIWHAVHWYNEGFLEKMPGREFLFALLACLLIGSVLKCLEESNTVLVWIVVGPMVPIIIVALYCVFAMLGIPVR